MSEKSPKDEPTTYNILFVCTGNTCRSPMAEEITRHLIDRRGWSHVSVESAGISAIWDAPASAGARAATEEIGLDLTGHRSQPLTERLVERADIVLAMTPGHLAEIEALGAGDKASLLTEFAEGEGAGQPIADPVGGGPDEYVEARDRIRQSVEGLLERLSAILQP